MVVHQHLIVRAEVQNPITSTDQAKEWLSRLVDAIGMKICKGGGPHAHYVDQPGNLGVASIVMIETSHASLHIWDQFDPPLVQFDVYSCAPYEVQTVFDLLEEMKPTKISYSLLDRESCVQQIDNGSREWSR